VCALTPLPARLRAPRPGGDPDDGHTDGIIEQPHEYERRVIDVFDDALLR
jgi:hypothetical protein